MRSLKCFIVYLYVFIANENIKEINRNILIKWRQVKFMTVKGYLATYSPKI